MTIHEADTAYRISPSPPTHRDARHWAIDVVRVNLEYAEGADTWLVRWSGELLDANGHWTSETSIPTVHVCPGSRWVFGRDAALAAARAAAPTLTVTGRTFAEWEAFWAARPANN